MAMAWYHTDLYHRVLSYSGTFVYQQWPSNPETPHGAWDFHEHLIPNTPVKPIRIWMEVGDRDNFNARDAGIDLAVVGFHGELKDVTLGHAFVRGHFRRGVVGGAEDEVAVGLYRSVGAIR